MDTFLRFAIPDVEIDHEQTEPVSMWFKEKNTYFPSIKAELMGTLPPGMYDVSLGDNGYMCDIIDIKTDELYTFKNAITNDILGEINKFWESKDKYKENNLIYKRGLLLYGFPGSGKSSYISLICENLIKSGGVVFKLDSVRDLMEYPNFIMYYFRKIQPDTPIITIVEDVDEYSDVESLLLDFLDGHVPIDNHLFIGTTNDLTNISDTLLRPSRIDLKFKVDLPDEETRKEYFQYKGINEDEIEELVSLTGDCSIADLKEVYICKEVFGYSIKDSIDRVKNPIDKKNYKNIENNQNNIEL